MLPGLSLALSGSVALVVMTESARDMTRKVGPMIVAGAGLSLAGLMLMLALMMFDRTALAQPVQNGWTMIALVASFA